MTDEKRPTSRASSLLNQINAVPFVPQSTSREQKSGSSTNVNAKPFTPSLAGGASSNGSNIRELKSNFLAQGMPLWKSASCL